jgi:hypothetical protein
MSSKKFATAVNCMDGRTQAPVAEYLKKMFQVDYVDTVTEPGPVKILAERTEAQVVAQIRKRVEISVYKHRSAVVAVVAHGDCAGNPVDEGLQRKQLGEAIRTMKSWGLAVEFLGLWVDEKEWQVERVL